MIECPNCSRQNEDEYRYCLGCGSVLPQPVAESTEATLGLNCGNCGAAVPVNFKFCGACGTPVDRSEASSVSSASESPPDPSPASDPEPRATSGEIGSLIVIKPDGSEGAKIPVTNSEITLGRSSEYDVLASDPFLSPAHASFAPTSGSQFVVKDLNSLNGVFLRIRSEVELQSGDQIRVGQELLEFHSVEASASVVEPASDDTVSGGSPDLGYWGRLSLVGGPEVETRGFVFSQDEVVIGREVGDVLFREDGFVSGKHARIAKVEGKIYLKDLGSSNGTYIRIKGQQEIGRGDLVLMGQQLFRLDLNSN